MGWILQEHLTVPRKVTLGVKARTIVGTGDTKPALTITLSEATLDLSDAKKATVRPKPIYDGSKFAISDEYRKIDQSSLDRTLTVRRSNLRDVGALINPAFADSNQT